eukprot:CAMPEP_0196663964 /NCGR_PEP_ID=MMETSP1086-20130531/54947_1 /TAXON_ID=77921 /ORGANISM="Cyanoptyche  gloeocystis , Strain SAG4.97" /LENGTH=142 /DNA_ID=CAMNT_0041999997 /DNA_START=151 /DNA_END=579 /DNA_ORIENTATION=+
MKSAASALAGLDLGWFFNEGRPLDAGQFSFKSEQLTSKARVGVNPSTAGAYKLVGLLEGHLLSDHEKSHHYGCRPTDSSSTVHQNRPSLLEPFRDEFDAVRKHSKQISRSGVFKSIEGFICKFRTHVGWDSASRYIQNMGYL